MGRRFLCESVCVPPGRARQSSKPASQHVLESLCVCLLPRWRLSTAALGSAFSLHPLLLRPPARAPRFCVAWLWQMARVRVDARDRVGLLAATSAKLSGKHPRWRRNPLTSATWYVPVVAQPFGSDSEAQDRYVGLFFDIAGFSSGCSLRAPSGPKHGQHRRRLQAFKHNTWHPTHVRRAFVHCR